MQVAGFFFTELSAYVRAGEAAINPAAPCTAVHDDLEYKDRGLDLEVSVSLEQPLAGGEPAPTAGTTLISL